MTEQDKKIQDFSEENRKLRAQVWDLVQRLNRTEKERDAAIADLTLVTADTFSSGIVKKCYCCKHITEKCWEMHRCEWEWRGVKEEQ